MGLYNRWKGINEPGNWGGSLYPTTFTDAYSWKIAVFPFCDALNLLVQNDLTLAEVSAHFSMSLTEEQQTQEVINTILGTQIMPVPISQPSHNPHGNPHGYITLDDLKQYLVSQFSGGPPFEMTIRLKNIESAIRSIERDIYTGADEKAWLYAICGITTGDDR